MEIKAFRNVPESLALSLYASKKFEIQIEDPSLSQYIYSTKLSTRLLGSEYAKLRREISRFNGLYSDSLQIIRSNQCLNEQKKQLYTELFTSWCEFGVHDSRSSIDEKLTFQNFIGLTDYKSFKESIIIEIWYKDRLVGFSVNDIVSDNFAINYFHITNLNLSGISYYLFYATCIELENKGVEYLNFQEDCGLIGLREFKNHLKPFNVENQYKILIPE
jgi:hypothetical protein